MGLWSNIKKEYKETLPERKPYPTTKKGEKYKSETWKVVKQGLGGGLKTRDVNPLVSSKGKKNKYYSKRKRIGTTTSGKPIYKSVRKKVGNSSGTIGATILNEKKIF